MTIVDRHSPIGRSALRAEQRVAKLSVAVPFVAAIAAMGLAVTGVAAPSGFVLCETALLYVLTVLGLTVGFHRLLTHGSFVAPRAVRAMLAVLGCMAAQGPPAFWVALHRAHHRYSDQSRDPHSPHLSSPPGLEAGEDAPAPTPTDSDAQPESNSPDLRTAYRTSSTLRGLWHAHVGWMFDPLPPDWPSFVGDLLHDRVMTKLGAAYGWWVAAGIAAPALGAGIIGHSIVDFALGALWGGLVRIFLVHQATWCVNSLCHLLGTRSFETRDDSRNNAFVALLTAGEGWHNNHHAFPTSARHGLRWWQFDRSYVVICGLAKLQFDLSYFVICGLAKLGLATRIRTAPTGRGNP